jgi:Beta-lactamase enzyme family
LSKTKHIVRKIVSVIFIVSYYHVVGQSVFSFDSIFSKKPILSKVSKDYKKYRLQIIYTQIERDKQGVPHFKSYNYKVDSSNYFYCASLVKLPCSILALEKLNALKLDKQTILFTDSMNTCQHTVKKDTSSSNGYPSIAQYIKRMLLVSDNVAYGRVYEFLGVDYIHERLGELGFKNTRIINRFDGGCKGIENVTTNPISFYDNNLNLVYHQKQQVAVKSYQHPLGVVKVGKAYLNAQNKKINEPKDFSNMNYLSLQTIHTLLQRLVFNDYYPKAQQYQLTSADRDFLMKYLTLYPRESAHPTYPQKTYYDSYKKYFIYGDSKKAITDTTLKITNIVGQSYGFMVDCAYITNTSKGIEFMLSAVIYTNEDEIINDGKYEYTTIALPYLAELGRQIYNYELGKMRSRR